MTMTDPIADMLTRLRNANVAHHDTTRMPSSKLKEALATILLREGYISDFKVLSDDKRPGRFLEVTMKYAPDRHPHHLRPAARVQARAACLHGGGQVAPGLRWPRRGRAVDQPGAHDGPRGSKAPGRRRNPLLRLVTGR